MRIAFFGLPIAALLLRQDSHEIVWCGLPSLGSIGSRRLSRIVGAERVHLAAWNEGVVLRQLRAARPDIIVSWFWTRKIPASILGLAPSFGVHPSLLPRHRGADPYFWAIDSGDEVTGVTAHALEEGYDTGGIIAQRQMRLDASWDAWQLARALDRPSLALLRDVARAFAEGRPLAALPQDERLATSAPQPSDEDLSITWSWPAERIARRVRAAAPWPGASTQIGDGPVTLVRVRATHEFPRALAPGEAAVRRDGVAIVRAADLALELLSGRGEDESELGVHDLAAMVDSARMLSIAPRDRLRFDAVD